MPYSSNNELPQGVRTALPSKAQTIFRNVFNAVLHSGSSEESAMKQAWGAVKNAGYEKVEDSIKWQLTKTETSVNNFISMLLNRIQGASRAPNYRPSDTMIQCQNCVHASKGNMCALYNFPFIVDWQCDSYQPGTFQAFKSDGDDMKVNVVKTDEEQRLVFGFFSINKVGQNLVEDLQGDLIDTPELEKAAYDFVLNARVAGEEHIRKNVGRLVESIMLTYEKQAAIQACLEKQGIKASFSLGCEGWFGGFRVEDDDVWKRVKDGDYPAFSIGGSGTRTPLD
jgi:cation transport regulator ChaB